MKWRLHSCFAATVTACMLLTACSSIGKKQNLGDLYAITPHGYPIDNDAYYVPPMRSTGCNSIHDSPTCGI